MSLHAVSAYTAAMVPLELPCELVDSLLPAELRRCETAVTLTGTERRSHDSDTHPVLVPLAHNYKTQLSGLPILSMDYLEFSVVIPGVRRLDDAQPLTYIPILFLNAWAPILVGRLFYGFPKRHAEISMVGGTCRAMLSSGTPLLDAELACSGTQHPPSDYPHFAPIRTMLEYPIVTQLFGFLPVCSTMRWQLDTVATVQPLRGLLKLHAAFLPGSAVRSFDIHGIDEAPMGAFELRTQWTLSMPHACHRGRLEAMTRPVPSVRS
jgi:hypothetical protein